MMDIVKFQTSFNKYFFFNLKMTQNNTNFKKVFAYNLCARHLPLITPSPFPPLNECEFSTLVNRRSAVRTVACTE